MKDLKTRIKGLVESSGSVNAMAKAMGLKQQTLQRIVTGAHKNPDVSTLSKIAEFYGTTVDWLLTERGDAPPFLTEREGNPLPQGLILEWRHALDKLQLEPGTLSEWVSVPSAVGNASFYAGLTDDTRNEELVAAVREARQLEYRAWLSWLKTLVKFKGEKGATAWLEANGDLTIAAGFKTCSAVRP